MSTANGASNTTKLDASSVGQSVNLDGFGGKVTRHDGVETTFKDLVDKSGAGVVVFTYPKASTPGCQSRP
jgi:thioredoxin-dependent peroxiredoxin